MFLADARRAAPISGRFSSERMRKRDFFERIRIRMTMS